MGFLIFYYLKKNSLQLIIQTLFGLVVHLSQFMAIMSDGSR